MAKKMFSFEFTINALRAKYSAASDAEGRGIGIANKIAAYSLQDRGADTVEANLQLGFPDEMREYLAVPDILLDMRIQSIRLITNNPFKIDQLKQLGVKVVDRVPIEI
eukprot:gene33704-39256_t